MIIDAGPAMRGVSSEATSDGVLIATAAGHLLSSKVALSRQPTGSLRASVNSILPVPAEPEPEPTHSVPSTSHRLP